jgi:hypothetical protein
MPSKSVKKAGTRIALSKKRKNELSDIDIKTHLGEKE